MKPARSLIVALLTLAVVVSVLVAVAATNGTGLRPQTGRDRRCTGPGDS